MKLLGPHLLSRFENCFLVGAIRQQHCAPLHDTGPTSPTTRPVGTLHEVPCITDSLGQPRVVLEANTLCRNPPKVVAEWCERIDLPYGRERPHLGAGDAARVGEVWGEWHASTARRKWLQRAARPSSPSLPRPTNLGCTRRTRFY